MPHRGVGRIKHMEAKHLWVHDHVDQGKLQIGIADTASIQPIWLTAEDLQDLFSMLPLTPITRGPDSGNVAAITATETTKVTTAKPRWILTVKGGLMKLLDCERLSRGACDYLQLRDYHS